MKVQAGLVGWACGHCGAKGVIRTETSKERMVRCVRGVRELADLLLAKIEYLEEKVKDDCQGVKTAKRKGG